MSASPAGVTRLVDRDHDTLGRERLAFDNLEPLRQRLHRVRHLAQRTEQPIALRRALGQRHFEPLGEMESRGFCRFVAVALLVPVIATGAERHRMPVDRLDMREIGGAVAPFPSW